jgi:DNA invertase Pin-like site-specific DNA recombinase
MSNLTQNGERRNHRAGSLSTKIHEEHLQLSAALYVRQSTSAQLRDHQESTARQYAMKDRLIALGWPGEQVIVIDDDLGISGSAGVERPGFRRLLKLVTDQRVGIVIGLEMSRLARNSRDWHDLFEVCGIFQTLIADEDGVFDPQDPNDRLVLGMKGIIAEMELHTMKVRLERGRLNKAQRGELFHDVPVGYVLDEHRLPRFDPDKSARHVMTMFFELFETLGSSGALFQHLVAV